MPHPKLPTSPTPAKSLLGADSAWLSGLELSAATQPPSAQQFACKSCLVSHERQDVKIVDDHRVASIVFGGSPKIGCVVGIRHDVSVVGSVIHTLRPRITQTEHETICEAPVPRHLKRIVFRTSVALFLLNGCESSRWSEVIEVLAGVCLQSSGHRLIDIEHSPVVQTAAAYVGYRQCRI